MSQLLLTDAQMRAVNEPAPRILLLAPAGSGKTEVLVRRVERVLSESQGASFRVLAVTYTLKAADELRGRVTGTVLEEAWRVDCDTIHGLALDWLRRYGGSVGVGANVVVYADDTDRLALVADYLRSLGLEEKLSPDATKTVRPILHDIDARRTLGAPLPRRTYCGVPIAELYDAYLSALALAGGIDFPGILAKFGELLEADPWVLSNFRSLYKHVLVDEGQDLTPAQSRIIASLATPPVELFVVADDRQSINGYAGGSFANAKSLVGETALTLHLAHNFRCSRRVLDAAERLATHLRASPTVALTGPGAPAGSVVVVGLDTPQVEAASTAAWIETMLERGLAPEILAEGEDPRVTPEQIAVIARSRWLLDPIMDELSRRGHQLSLNLDPSGLLMSPEGRLLFEAICIIADPSDRPARRRFLEELAVITGVDGTGDALADLRATHREELAAIADHLEPLHGEAPVLDQLGCLAQVFGSMPWKDDALTIERYWLEYRGRTSTEQRSLKAYLRHLSRAQLARPSDPGVRLLTIHRVKGLEFRAVAVLGVYEGALPDYRAKTAPDIDAERRSLYVAMTRAKRVLRLSWPATMTDRTGRRRVQRPSPFLEEAGLIEAQAKGGA